MYHNNAVADIRHAHINDGKNSDPDILSRPDYSLSLDSARIE